MPGQLLPSGAVEFQPQEHTACGLCGSSFMLCQCEGLPHACDYTMVGLPPPAPNSTRAQLLKRWCSLMKSSMSMGVFDADRWYTENQQVLLASLQERSQLFHEMVEDYIASLSQDATLPTLAKVVGGIALQNKSATQNL